METVTRAIEMPIAWPSDKETQQAFGKAINRSLDASAHIANRVQAEYYRQDAAGHAYKESGKIALPKLDRNAGYKVARAAPEAQNMPAGSASAIATNVFQKWTGKDSNGWPRRISALTGNSSVPSYRSMPYPIRKQEVWGKRRHPHLGRGGEPFIWLPLVGDSGTEWWEIQLKHKAKRGHRRQYDTFKKIVEGEVSSGEVQIYQKTGANRHVVMCKIVVQLPVQPTAEQQGTLVVRTRPDKLLVASKRGNPKDWSYNARHIREMIYNKRDRDQELREDSKAEYNKAGRGPRKRLQRESIKHNKRVKHFLHNCSKHIVGYARRCRVQSLIFDDTDRSYLPAFAYSEIQSMIKQKCDEAGIDFQTIDEARAEAQSRRASQKQAQEMAAIEQQLQSLKGLDDESDSDSDSE